MFSPVAAAPKPAASHLQEGCPGNQRPRCRLEEGSLPIIDKQARGPPEWDSLEPTTVSDF